MTMLVTLTMPGPQCPHCCHHHSPLIPIIITHHSAASGSKHFQVAIIPKSSNLLAWNSITVKILPKIRNKAVIFFSCEGAAQHVHLSFVCLSVSKPEFLPVYTPLYPLMPLCAPLCPFMPFYAPFTPLCPFMPLFVSFCPFMPLYASLQAFTCFIS